MELGGDALVEEVVIEVEVEVEVKVDKVIDEEDMVSVDALMEE